MNKASAIAGAALVAAAVAAGAWWWWASRTAPAPPATARPAEVAATPAASAASEVASAPAIVYPVEAASEPAGAPLDLRAALDALFGRQAVLRMLQTDDFARRVVATVDNLGRAQAPARLWPVNPTAGRFTVRAHDGAQAIDARNAARYAAFLRFVESADLQRVAATYVRLYPQFQKAYEELGYPNRYFNDRLVEVIDLLLATPQVADPLAVRLPAINSPYRPERPWVLYEFEDPALNALSAGQKILLRMGADHARRLKARLSALRALVASGATRR